MRIGIVAPEFPPEIGGMQRYAWEVAEGLSRRQCAVTVFTKKGSGGGIAGTTVNVIPCLVGSRWQDKQVISARSGDFDLWHVMNAAWAWVAQEADPVFLSVHGNDFLNPNRVVNLALRQRYKLPFGSRLDYYVSKWLTERSLRKSLPRMHHIFANSKATEVLFLNRFPLCKKKTSVGFVGVSDFFLHAPRQTAVRKESTCLITVCRLSEQRKNVDVVLLALARLKDIHDFRYYVIGEGPLRPKLEHLANALGLGDRVQFLGESSDEALRDRLLASDLFILTSSASTETVEGFGIAYLEANACGVPVLAARVGGAAEAVAVGRSGMFIDTVTPETVAAALHDFLAGKIRFDRDVCRAFAQTFSWPTILDRILARYAEVSGTFAGSAGDAHGNK